MLTLTERQLFSQRLTHKNLIFIIAIITLKITSDCRIISQQPISMRKYLQNLFSHFSRLHSNGLVIVIVEPCIWGRNEDKVSNNNTVGNLHACHLLQYDKTALSRAFRLFSMKFSINFSIGFKQLESDIISFQKLPHDRYNKKVPCSLLFF